MTFYNSPVFLHAKSGFFVEIKNTAASKINVFKLAARKERKVNIQHCVNVP
jgi:hypothetical protein